MRVYDCHTNHTHHTDHTHKKINALFVPPIPWGGGGAVRCMLSKSPAALVKQVKKVKKGLLVHPSTHPCPKLR